MIYPGNISGPELKDGDLAEFIFDGAALTLPLFKIPLNDRRVDELSKIKDFRGIDTRRWDTDGFDNPIFTIASQKWKFEDSISFDNIAICRINTGIMEVTDKQKAAHMALSKSALKKYTLDMFAIVMEDEEDEYMDQPDWPKIHNGFNYQCIKKPQLDWLQIQMCWVDGSQPSPMAFIPVDNRFILTISFHMQSLHYQDRTNPYSNKLIRKLEFELFDEYMQSINLKYTDETRTIIESLRE